MATGGWDRLATVTVATKRATISNGKRGAPQTYLSNLKATPLVAADPGRVGEIRQRLKLDTPHKMLETVIVGTPDIRPGDFLAVGGDDHVIRGCAVWASPNSAFQSFTHLTVEDVQS